MPATTARPEVGRPRPASRRRHVVAPAGVGAGAPPHDDRRGSIRQGLRDAGRGRGRGGGHHLGSPLDDDRRVVGAAPARHRARAGHLVLDRSVHPPDQEVQDRAEQVDEHDDHGPHALAPAADVAVHVEQVHDRGDEEPQLQQEQWHHQQQDPGVERAEVRDVHDRSPTGRRSRPASPRASMRASCSAVWLSRWVMVEPVRSARTRPPSAGRRSCPTSWTGPTRPDPRARPRQIRS